MGLTISAREKWLSAQHLCKHAADTPDVDGTGVFLEGQHDFWRTVPS